MVFAPAVAVGGFVTKGRVPYMGFKSIINNNDASNGGVYDRASHILVFPNSFTTYAGDGGLIHRRNTDWR